MLNWCYRSRNRDGTDIYYFESLWNDFDPMVFVLCFGFMGQYESVWMFVEGKFNCD
jgi:hypothetical protein